jgi:hypothetical protein
MKITETTISEVITDTTIKYEHVSATLTFRNVEPGAEDDFILHIHYVDIGKGEGIEGGRSFMHFSFNDAGVQYSDRSMVAEDFLNYINDCIGKGWSEIKEGFTDVFDGLHNYIDNVVDEMFRDYEIKEED